MVPYGTTPKIELHGSFTLRYATPETEPSGSIVTWTARWGASCADLDGGGREPPADLGRREAAAARAGGSRTTEEEAWEPAEQRELGQRKAPAIGSAETAERSTIAAAQRAGLGKDQAAAKKRSRSGGLGYTLGHVDFLWLSRHLAWLARCIIRPGNYGCLFFL
jgi:hypothetical protein